MIFWVHESYPLLFLSILAVMSGFGGHPILRELLCLIFIFCTKTSLRVLMLAGSGDWVFTRGWVYSCGRWHGDVFLLDLFSLQEGCTFHRLILAVGRRVRQWYMFFSFAHGLVRSGIWLGWTVFSCWQRMLAADRVAKDQVHTFLELLKHRIKDHKVRAFGFLAAYIAYHIWLTRNVLVFDSRRCSARVITERACIHANEMSTVPSTSTKT